MDEERWTRLWEKNWKILIAVLHEEDFPLLRDSQSGMTSANAGGMLLGRNEVINQIFHRELHKLVRPAAPTLRISRRFRPIGRAAREWRLLIPLRPGREIIPEPKDGEPKDGPPVHLDHGICVRPESGPRDRLTAARLWRARGLPNVPPVDATFLLAGEHGAVWVDPNSGEQTEYGIAGRIVALAVASGHEEDGTARALLVVALEHLRDQCVRGGAIVVDAEDHALVYETRLLGFMHDRTDVQYTVGVVPPRDA